MTAATAGSLASKAWRDLPSSLPAQPTAPPPLWRGLRADLSAQRGRTTGRAPRDDGSRAG